MRARATAAFSAVLALIGVSLIVETAVVGALFLLAGGLRLYLSTR